MEIIRNVTPFPQPSPAKNPGGDCFACALTAAVRALFPDRPVAFDAVWQCFMVDCSDGKKTLSNTWPTMRTAVYKLRELDYDLEVRQDLVLPHFKVDTWSQSWWYAPPEEEWAYRLEAWLAAGWIALAEMNFAGSGLFNPDGSMNVTDHFVVLDGQRHFWQSHPTVAGASSLEHETHVICSSKGAYWIHNKTLLRKHGVAGLTLIRKDIRARR